MFPRVVPLLSCRLLSPAGINRDPPARVPQMLAIASNQKRDALKVIHSSSCAPFTNWPTERTPVRYPFALDFSPGGGFLAVGNDRGCVLLYRLRHYPQA